MRIKNFSRHDLNEDQVIAIAFAAEDLGWPKDWRIEAPSAPFFEGLDDFVAQAGGHVAMAVLPGDILRDAWANQLEDCAIPDGTTLIGWRTDQSARKRGRFAVRGVVIHQWKTVSAGCGLVVMPVKIYEAEVDPTVENDFRTGERFRYEGQTKG